MPLLQILLFSERYIGAEIYFFLVSLSLTSFRKINRERGRMTVQPCVSCQLKHKPSKKHMNACTHAEAPGRAMTVVFFFWKKNAFHLVIYPFVVTECVLELENLNR